MLGVEHGGSAQQVDRRLHGQHVIAVTPVK